MNVLYIPSKKRAPTLEVAFRKYPDDPSIDKIIVVVECDDVPSYEEVVASAPPYIRGKTDVVELPDVNRGIAFARNFINDHAVSEGLYCYICSDDEAIPISVESTFFYCNEFDEKVGGVGLYQVYYDFSLKLDRGQGLVKHTRSMGMICMALRTDVIKELGGFDESLIRYSDYDLRAKAALAGYHWFIDTDSDFQLIGGSHSEGGLQSIGANTEDVQEICYDILHPRYGDKLIRYNGSKEKNKIRFMWSNFSKGLER